MTDATRALTARWQAVRRQTEALAAPLTPEDQQLQSMPDASPTKWHLAHTTWFFETFVLARLPGHRPFRPEYAFLFNSYYEAVGPRVARAARGLQSRPGLEEVRAYRGHVDAALARALEAGALDAEGLALVELGLQHEQQHQELLLTDAQHALAQSPLHPAYRAPPPAPPRAGAAAAPLAWTRHEPGLVQVGHAGDGFAFDNERPRHRAYAHGFALASRLVTCGEWLAFMEDGGYARPAHWLSDGWAAVQQHGWRAPLYWEQRDGAWWHFTLHGLTPVDPAAPVAHVSHYEADAFARWAGARLPTEVEWEVAAASQPVSGNLLESGALAPRPAAPGASQLYGDCWEWTQSAYLPYPGFRTAPGAVGEYNGKFMSGQLVLRGGSCFTPQAHVRASYRNFFPPAARWQMTGLRLARDA